MDTDDPATSRAFISIPLVFEKGIYPVLFNLVEIVNHTHMIGFSIAFINASQTMAGKIIAFKAEGNPVMGQLFAMAFEKGTLFVSRAASGTVSYFASLSGKISGVSEVDAADTAVHAAGGD